MVNSESWGIGSTTHPGPEMSESGAAILERLIELDVPTLSPEAARSALRLDFPEADHDRVRILSVKAQEGALTRVERAELEAYLRVADRLALLQSKARLSLKRAGVRA